jgi:hypothetical protein
LFLNVLKSNDTWVHFVAASNPRVSGGECESQKFTVRKQNNRCSGRQVVAKDENI